MAYGIQLNDANILRAPKGATDSWLQPRYSGGDKALPKSSPIPAFNSDRD